MWREVGAGTDPRLVVSAAGVFTTLSLSPPLSLSTLSARLLLPDFNWTNVCFDSEYVVTQSTLPSAGV